MSKNAIKKDLTELSHRLNPKDIHRIIQFAFGIDSDPHGFLHGNRLHMLTQKGKTTRWYEALTTEAELKEHKEYYDKILADPQHAFMKAPGHPFHSFESYIEYGRCTCGKHGSSNMEPYLGENKP